MANVVYRICQGPTVDNEVPCLLSTIHYQPSTIRHQPSTIHHQPSTIHHQPSTIHHPPSTINHQPSTIHHQPSTIHYQLFLQQYPHQYRIRRPIHRGLVGRIIPNIIEVSHIINLKVGKFIGFQQCQAQQIIVNRPVNRTIDQPTRRCILD